MVITKDHDNIDNDPIYGLDDLFESDGYDSTNSDNAETIDSLHFGDEGDFWIISKSWQSWISEPKFIKSHLQHSYLRDHDNSQIGNRRIIISDISNFIRRQYATNYVHFNWMQLNLIGSSNGLVCVSPTHGEFIVVNPETREVKKLTDPQIPLTGALIYGFGYDSLIEDFKVVLGFKKSNGLTCFNILTLRSNTWEAIEEVDYTTTDTCFRSIGILFNGVLHWVAYRGLPSFNNQRVILSFDLSENKFKEILPPDDIGDYRNIRLGIMDDCLCVFCSKMFPDNIWVMHKYGVKESWDRVGPERKIKADIVHRLKELQQYIPNSKSLCHERWVSQNTEFIGSHLYIPSLVSPHAFEETETNNKKRKDCQGSESCISSAHNWFK